MDLETTGGHAARDRVIEAGIVLIEDGDVQVAPLISGHFALGELDAVLEQVAAHQVYGAIMTP